MNIQQNDFSFTIQEDFLTDTQKPDIKTFKMALMQNAREEIIQQIVEKFDSSVLMTTDQEGNNPLHLAIIHHADHKIVQLLVDRLQTKEIEKTNHDALTALDLAIIQKAPYEICKILIDHSKLKYKFEFGKKQPRFMELAFIHSIDPNILILLIEKSDKSIFKLKDEQKNTLVHLAILHHADQKVLYALLQKVKPLDLLKKNNKKESPFSFAIAQDIKMEIFYCLIEKLSQIKPKELSKHLKHKEKDSLLQIAIKNKARKEMIKLIISSFGPSILTHKNQHGDTPLHVALRYVRYYECEETVDLLIKSGFDLDVRNDYGESCAWWMSIQGLPLPEGIKESDYDREFNERHLLANIWSLDYNTGKLDGKPVTLTDGGASVMGGQKVYEYLKKYEKYIHLQRPELEHFKIAPLLKLLKENRSFPQTISSLEMLGSRKFINFSTGGLGHAFQIDFFKILNQEYMSICDRLYGKRTSSITTYAIECTGHSIDEEDFSHIERADLVREKAIPFFYEILPKKLGVKTEDKIVKFFNQTFKHRKQKVSNCWWINSKLSIIPMTIALNIEPFLLQEYPDEEAKDQALQLFFTEVNTFYKEFSEFARLTILKEYLDSPPGKYPKDHQLTRAVVEKMEKNLERDHQTNQSLPVIGVSEIRAAIKKYKTTYNLDEQFQVIRS